MALPDLDTPDLGHANLAAHIVDHLEQLADSFLLGQTAADFAQTVLTNFTALQQAVTGQATQIADLEMRVAALENPTPPTA